MPAAPIKVILARAEEGEIRLDEFSLPSGATLAQALEEAIRRRIIGADDLAANAVAVFGRRRGPDEVLHDGDRIELLGPLFVDPKEARQRRVAHRRAAAPKDRWRAG